MASFASVYNDATQRWEFVDTSTFGGGAVDSVFGRTGAVVAASGDYDADEITETASNKIMTAAERTKLAGIETGANLFVLNDGDVTNAKRADMPAWTLSGNNSGSPAAPQDIAAGDLAPNASPTSGQKFVTFGPGGLEYVDWDDLPSGGGGLTNPLTTDLDAGANDLTNITNVVLTGTIGDSSGDAEVGRDFTCPRYLFADNSLYIPDDATSGAGIYFGVGSASELKWSWQAATSSLFMYVDSVQKFKLSGTVSQFMVPVTFSNTITTASVAHINLGGDFNGGGGYMFALDMEPDKFGLGVTPIATQAHIADPSGGATVDSEARTAIAAINARLEAFGFSATS